MPDFSLNWTARSSAMQKWYVNDAACPAEDSPAKAGGLSASSLPLSIRHGCQTVRWKSSAWSSGWSRVQIKLFFFTFLFPSFCCFSICTYLASVVIDYFNWFLLVLMLSFLNTKCLFMSSLGYKVLSIYLSIVWFYDISTFVGYLMPNFIFIQISSISNNSV